MGPVRSLVAVSVNGQNVFINRCAGRALLFSNYLLFVVVVVVVSRSSSSGSVVCGAVTAVTGAVASAVVAFSPLLSLSL